MAYDGLLIRALIQELRREISGFRVEKINQPQRGAFVFGIKNKNLLISVEPSAAYITLTDQKFDNPPQPPMFCMLLRKYLSGAVLTDIRQEGCDRTVYFVFTALSSAYEPTTRTLVAEIMGRHANLLLLDEEHKIIDCIKRSALDARQALPGLPYEPFADTRSNPLNGAFREDTNFLKEFQGFSKMSARFASLYPERIDELLRPDPEMIRGYTSADADGNLTDLYFHKDVFPDGCTVKEYPTLSEAIHAFYMRSLHDIRLKKISQEIRKTVLIRLERTRTKIQKMEAELAEAENSEHLRIYGDLLLANAHRIGEGANKALLTDFEGRPVEIPLDTKISATDNAQKYYQKYKKNISAVKNIKIRMQEAAKDEEFLSASVSFLDNAEQERDIEEVRRELIHAGFLNGGSKTKRTDGKNGGHDKKTKNGKLQKNSHKTALHVHRFLLSSGKTLLIGRSNTGNDELTMRYASNSDTWLHTNTVPGSHCVIRCEGSEPTDEDLKEAAMAAAYYSKARNSGKVAVDYCKIKYIKKPPASRAGMVTYSNFKTVIVEPSIDHLTQGDTTMNTGRSHEK